MIRFVMLFCVVCLVGCGRCEETQSTLTLEITGCMWEKKRDISRDNQEKLFTKIKSPTQHEKENDRELAFEGMHDFHKGKTYKITVITHSGKLVKFEEVKPEAASIKVRIDPQSILVAPSKHE